MPHVSVTVVAVATLAFWLNLESAESAKQGCQSPGAKFLSRVFFATDKTGTVFNDANTTQASGVYPEGTEVRYLCDPGYVLVGKSARVCREGRWTETAPHCYLNVAERSSLSVKHTSLADGDKTTDQFLRNLFQKEGGSLHINLYFSTKVVQVIFIADEAITGSNMTIYLMKNGAMVIGTTAELRPSRRQSGDGHPPEYIAFEDIEGKSPEADALQISLPKWTSYTGQKIYEIQIVAATTDLSWRQCLDEVGSSVTPMQRNTWAVDGRCYHLITQPDKRLHAEKGCQRLGTEGTLYEPVAGLDLALDMLNVEGVFRLQTRSKTHVWVQGMEEQDSEDPAASGDTKGPRCRLLSPKDRNFTYGDCDERHPYICQRAPRLCGRFPRQAGLHYTPPEVTGAFLRDHTVNVTCADTNRTGQIHCLAPDWTKPNFCRRTVTGSARPPTQKPPGGHLSAILGGAVGGVIVLALTALGVIRGRNGHRQRRRHKQFVPPVDDSSEFLGLNPNPIYGGSQHEDEHLYSEVSNPDAIYEECSYTAPVKQPSPEPPPPPPLPTSRPSVGSLPDAADAPSTDDIDYEVFPMETAPAPTGGVLTTGRSTTAAGTSAPPAQEDPDYEPFPIDPQMPSGESSSATGLSISDPPRSFPAVPEISRPPTLEYAVPLVGGKQPDGRQLNHSFNTLPIGVAPVADEAEYAQPYRASRADTARRSIPDVALNAMGMSRTESG
ncbi:uncharacterized protein LOC122368928 [Amphibalanus amphitrite]|uniref:uncharacterized protein LOC122368928 n=1 Tax=Amphibalanus amphitrite TaxID=1232801 RepID=UPI001C8FD6CD|nr:uncharacterized protein LOC122368928 [Amphibalanus amphitrite]